MKTKLATLLGVLALSSCGVSDGPSLNNSGGSSSTGSGGGAGGNVASSPVVNGKLTVTNLSPNNITFTWAQATDADTPQANLTYAVYRSAVSPAYQSFASVAQVEAGTAVAGCSGTAISSCTSAAEPASGVYQYNVVVTNAAGNKTAYTPQGEHYTANLLIYYPFDGNVTNVVTGGGALSGVATGAPTAAADRRGFATSAYTFSGAGQYVTSGGATGISGAGARGISLWLKRAGGIVAASLGENATVANHTFGLYVNTNKWFGWCYQVTCDFTSGVTPTTSWEFWAIVYDGTNFSIYKNGNLVVNPALVLNTDPGYLRVGTGVPTSSNDQNDFFSGQLDDVRVYSANLPAGDVVNLYNATRP